MPTLDVQTMIDQCAQSGGGTVVLPAGTYDCISPWVIPECVIVRGPGSAYGSLSAFVGKFALAVAPEQCVHVSGAGAQLHDVGIQGPGLNARAKTGVLVSGHASLVSGVSTHYFTDFGFHVFGSTGQGTNANGFTLERCRAVHCGSTAASGGAGFYVNGSDANAGRISGCTAESNEGFGFFESAFLGNGYYGNHGSLNALGNYAQGGSIEDPLDGGVANYSVYCGNYSELTAYHLGHLPPRFRSAQIAIDPTANLDLQAEGWNGAPFPGLRSGYRSKLRFEHGGVVFVAPAPRAPIGSIVHAPGREEWQVMQDWIGSPSWLANTVAVARHGKTGWLVPYAATHEGHPAGPGRLVQGTPLVNSPFRFAFRRDVTVTPGTPLAVQIDSDLLKETAGGYLGVLCLEAPSILRPLDAPQIAHSGWERVDANSVRTVLTTDGPNPVACMLVLSGGRAEP